MFKLMYDFGLRASEVGKLTLKDFDLDLGRLQVAKSQGRRYKILRLSGISPILDKTHSKYF